MGLFLKDRKKQGHKSAEFHGNETQDVLHKNLPFTAKEQYKLIRANLDFTLPESEDGMCPVIGVTSSIRGEGKSTTSINLSYVFAEKGSKILLIDGDLRIPTVAKRLELESTPGLSDLLRDKDVRMPKFQSYLLDNWFVLPSGDIPPNPSELLGSSRMENVLNQLRKMFDYIIIDLPPVNLVSDAVSISGLISGMIVVIREEYTEKKELERCVRQLKLSGVKILGCILNEARSEGGGYGKYKYKKSKYYHYEDSSEEKTAAKGDKK